MTTKSEADRLIEGQEWITRDTNRPYGSALVPLHNQDYRTMIGSEFCSYFETYLFGSTDKYTWETRKVDQLSHLRIWAK